jgi:hypothetical protein
MDRGRVRPALPHPLTHWGTIVNLEQAREYLARTVPWPQDGEEPFHVGIHYTVKPQDRDKPYWTGRAVKSVDDAVRALKWITSLPDTRDVYVCMSGLSQTTEKVSAKGHKYLVPVRGQQTAVKLKSLFLDIDVKGNGYPDLTQAVTALADFLMGTGLPKPTMIVSSGGGMHVYWTLVRALTVAEWQPLANALAEAVKKHGLKADTSCTVDAARVLRVPDTLNCKTEQRRPVRLVGKRLDFDYLNARIEQALEPYMAPADPMLAILPPRPPLPGINDLAAGIEVTSRMVDLDKVAPECEFIKQALDTGGKDYPNPLWNLTTLLAVFTNGGRADAHRMADKHPGYSSESTDELFDRKAKEQEAKGLGWPSCKTIATAGCSACGACKHKDEGKSPFHFEVRAQLPTPPAPAAPVQPPSGLPPGYRHNADGLVCREVVEDTTGRTFLVPILNYPMSNAWLQSDPWILNFTATTHTGHKKQIAIPLTNTATKEGIPKALTAQGIVCQDSEQKHVREFIVNWIRQLQNTKNSVVASSPFGWQIKNGAIEGFIYGGEIVTPTGTRAAANPDPIIARQYTPTGSAKFWKQAVKMITDQKRPALDAIIASAFGAPLVHFMGQPGVLMSCYSMESGIGKSTALKVAQTVWGDPISGMQGLSDTPLSVMKKIGQVRSLPIYWDELKTDDDTRKFVNMVFSLTKGSEKSRLNQDVTMREGGTWMTMLISASNDSLVDFVVNRTKTTTAGIYRIFEYEVRPGVIGQINPAEADHLLGKLNNNYGAVGQEYAKWLGQNFVQIDKDVAECQTRLVTDLNMANDERFWRATMAAAIMGARYANQLGYTEIDEDALYEFLVQTLNDMRGLRKNKGNDLRDSMNVSNVLTQYLNAMRARHTLWTNKVHISNGKPPKGLIQVMRDASRLDGIYVHVGVEDKLMRISSTHFSEWLADAGYSRHLFTRALEQEFGSRSVRGRIGSGTDFAGGTEYLIQIDLAGTPLANFLDEE